MDWRDIVRADNPKPSASPGRQVTRQKRYEGLYCIGSGIGDDISPCRRRSFAMSYGTTPREHFCAAVQGDSAYAFMPVSIRPALLRRRDDGTLTPNRLSIIFLMRHLLNYWDVELYHEQDGSIRLEAYPPVKEGRVALVMHMSGISSDEALITLRGGICKKHFLGVSSFALAASSLLCVPGASDSLAIGFDDRILMHGAEEGVSRHVQAVIDRRQAFFEQSDDQLSRAELELGVCRSQLKAHTQHLAEALSLPELKYGRLGGDRIWMAVGVSARPPVDVRLSALDVFGWMQSPLAALA